MTTSPAELYIEKASKAMLPLHTMTYATWAHATSLFEQGQITAEDYAALFSAIVDCMVANAAAPLRLVDNALAKDCFEKIFLSLKQNYTALAAERNLTLHFDVHVQNNLIMPS